MASKFYLEKLSKKQKLNKVDHGYTQMKSKNMMVNIKMVI